MQWGTERASQVADLGPCMAHATQCVCGIPRLPGTAREQLREGVMAVRLPL